MAQNFSLQPLLEIMQSRTDDATRQLGKLIAEEKNAQQRLQLLENYRNEYAQRFQTAAATGLSPLAWQNYQEFLGRLDEAVAQQRHAVHTSSQNTQQGQEHWREQNNRLKALDTLSERYAARARQAESKRDQKLSDEFAARKFRTDRGG